MAMFIQNNAAGGGAGTLDPNQAAIDLGVAVNGDTGLGLAAAVGNRQQVTYAPTITGPTMTRINNLVNTNFSPNYGAGAQNVDTVILAVQSNFVLNDGTPIVNAGGVALPPQNSGLAGATLNTSNDCLVIYDTSQSNGAGYCAARAGTGGTLDLQTSNPVILYHELSHAFRIVTNALLALTAGCNPSSPEENAAITDENDLRTLIATATGTTAVLRDPGIHCGGTCSGGAASCCIIASVASGSPLSGEVQWLRHMRDHIVRATEAGYAFFDRLLRDYYAFSPQVCTHMARDPELPNIVYNGYVAPLISAIKLLQAYSFDGADNQTLGALFSELTGDDIAAQEQLDGLEKLQHFLLSDEGAEKDNDRAQIRALLAEEAFTSHHVQWGLIDIVTIFASALKARMEKKSDVEIGDFVISAFDNWSAEAPIDAMWGSLPEAKTRRELRFVRDHLLRSNETRQRFASRLMQEFGHIQSLAKGVESELSFAQGAGEGT